MRRVGLLMDTTLGYGRRVFTGIRQSLLPDLDIEFCMAPPAGDGVQRWIEQGIDGIIAMVHDPAIAELLAAWGGPVVNVSSRLDTPLPRVILDDVAVGALAGNYFLDRHFSHFAFVGRTGMRYSLKRQEGFARRLSEHGLRVRELAIDPGQPVSHLARLFADLPLPLAMFVLGEDVARDALAACRACELRVPDTVAILSGSDSDDLCACLDPPVSMVDLPLERVGAEAGEMLLCQMRGEALERPDRLLPPNGIVERLSTAFEAIDDPEIIVALAYIRRRFAEDIGVDDVAEAVGTGRRHLERRFQSEIGTGIYQHILRTRIDHVKALLRRTELSLSAIAARTGFASSRHLCATFKRLIGVTPTRFRTGAA